MDIEYLMENPEESIRLAVKTDPEAVKQQALWCGLKPGMRVLDAGCGPGRVTSILNDMIQPGGEIVGVDYSEDRIRYANKHYNKKTEIFFQVHDLRQPLTDFGLFDLIWIRFVLEYNRSESHEIINNLSACVKPGGHLCLMDLDYNCLTHFKLPEKMEELLHKLMKKLEQNYNFDAYIGRKLYSYIYDLGYQNIRLDLKAHHLFYGEIRDEDFFNWFKKLEVASIKTEEIFEDYSGGREAFLEDFKRFFIDPRRFTYTPLIICRGSKPPSS